MVIKGTEFFPPRAEFNANYDWINLLSTTGYVVFDGINMLDASGNNYILIQEDNAETLQGLSTTVDAVMITQLNANSGQSCDLDFDSSILQVPRTIEGDCYVRVSLADAAAGGAFPNGTVITAKLRKWDGTTETEIANAVSTTKDLTDAGHITQTLKIAVPRTHFKKGDLIRMTILVSTTDNDDYWLGHNPADNAIESFDAGNSRLVVAIPFKLDFM